MSGYRADLDAITAAAGVLRATLDSVAAVHDQLDVGVCAGMGPGRLAAVAAGLTNDARRDLDGVRRAVTQDVDLVTAAAHGYAETDTAAADLLTRRAAEPG